MVVPLNQQNLSEHKKALRIRSQHIQKRERILNQKRRHYSTNLKPNRLLSLNHHHSSISEFKFEHVQSMRKIAPFSNQVEDIPKLANDLDLTCNPFQIVYDAAFRLRKFLSIEHQPPIAKIIDSGAVQYFVQYLDVTQIEQYCQVKKSSGELSDPSKMNVISLRQLYALQYEVTWCITNIVSDTSDHVEYIVEMGCVPLLINLLESEDCEVRRQCIWAIGNIAGDSYAMRDYVIGLGVMNRLVKLVEMDQTIPTRRNAVWAICNLLREKPNWDLVNPAIPLLCQLILDQELDEEVLNDACWSLSFVATNGPPDVKEHITKQDNVIMRIVDLLNHSNPNIQKPALITLENLLVGTCQQTQQDISCGLLLHFTRLFVHPNKCITKNIMWTISSITVYNVCKKFCYHSNDVQFLIEQGMIQHLCGGLDMDSCVSSVILEGLKVILNYADKSQKVITKIIEDCGGVEQIKALQHHTNEDVKQKSLHLLEVYWKAY